MDRTTMPRHQRPSGLKTFLFGVPYYPEHWRPEDRLHDPQRMADAGVNVVRMAEFAWDRIEPSRGQFDFSLFDETIARLGEHGIRTILCTPTATPPRWLTQDHEDWMRVDESGKRMDHGTRQHCCTSNEQFRSESRRITACMAAHYADNPDVIGWQTDNEFYCHFRECYCQACREGFRNWLRQKYGTIDALNAAWGNAFWALTYSDFEQIPPPYPATRPAFSNPSHELDYHRYGSDSIIEFQRQQVQALRAAQGRWWITHNGVFPGIDQWRFAADLDFNGVDIYPGFAGKMPQGAPWAAALAQRCRASSGGFVVPEQQGGPGGQRPYLHPAPQPGQMRLWAYQSIAHGADGILHFRWRTCRFGAETYWHGILDHDNIPRRRYGEFAQEGCELARLGPAILNTVVDVQAAVLTDFEQSAASASLHLGLPTCDNQRDLAFGELWRRRLPCGLVEAADRLDGLKLLVLPSMPLMTQDFAAKLTDFVSSGGVLVVLARSAIRDINNHATPHTPPNFLQDLCGCTVEEFSAIEEGQLSLSIAGAKADVPSGRGYEILKPSRASVAATWGDFGGAPCEPAGKAAICVNQFGSGKVLAIGTYLSEANRQALMDLALSLADVQPLAAAEDCVEVARRHGAGRRLTFIMNHLGRPTIIRGLPSGAELISGAPCGGELKLDAYGVAVVEG